MKFAIPTDQTVKIKDSEKIDKFLEIPSEPRKLWKMKVTVIPIIVGTLGTLLKDLERILPEL